MMKNCINKTQSKSFCSSPTWYRLDDVWIHDVYEQKNNNASPSTIYGLPRWLLSVTVCVIHTHVHPHITVVIHVYRADSWAVWRRSFFWKVWLENHSCGLQTLSLGFVDFAWITWLTQLIDLRVVKDELGCCNWEKHLSNWTKVASRLAPVHAAFYTWNHRWGPCSAVTCLTSDPIAAALGARVHTWHENKTPETTGSDGTSSICK